MVHNNLNLLKDCCDLTEMHFNYLHLGLFYSTLTKENDLSKKCPEKLILKTEVIHQEYYFNGSHIKLLLQDIYKKNYQHDIFSYITIINAIRSITMAFYELHSRGSDIVEKIKKEVFKNDKYECEVFFKVVEFIRHTLVHNIRDEIRIKINDIKSIKNFCDKSKKKQIEFTYNYSLKDSAINIPDYNPNLHIILNFNEIKENMPYNEIINTYQNILFAEFCCNLVVKLKEIYKI